jgi:NarL family two-component system sensor histidine kinase LiaS
LASALHTRLEAVESRTGLQVKVTVAGTLDLSPEQEGQLYKIAQEALNNVIKHANATTVTVQLDGSDDTQFCLTIQDDGIGFAPKPDKPDAGLGLRSMRERAQQIGGDLTIRSARGEGTTVQVTVKNQKL